jgi:hypothetical protein
VTLPIRPKDSQIQYEDLVPRYEDMVLKLHGRVNSLLGFPLCVISKIQEKILLPEEEIADSMKLYLIGQNFVKLKRCSECRLKHKCAGTFKEYIKIFGDKMIIPFV